MKEVYLVTSGQCSDYSVIAIFSKREDAEIFKENGRYDYIEEWDVDNGIQHVRNGYVGYRVTIEKTGDGNAYQDGIPDNKWYLRHCRIGRNIWEGMLTGTCWARSEGHALKIATEKRAQLIALDRWNRESEGELNNG